MFLDPSRKKKEGSKNRWNSLPKAVAWLTPSVKKQRKKKAGATRGILNDENQLSRGMFNVCFLLMRLMLELHPPTPDHSRFLNTHVTPSPKESPYLRNLHPTPLPAPFLPTIAPANGNELSHRQTYSLLVRWSEVR